MAPLRSAVCSHVCASDTRWQLSTRPEVPFGHGR